MPFYAVARGHTTGIFSTWSECEKNTKGISKPIFRKFKSREEAENFMNEKLGSDNDESYTHMSNLNENYSR